MLACLVFFGLYSSKLAEPAPSEADWGTAVMVPEIWQSSTCVQTSHYSNILMMFP